MTAMATIVMAQETNTKANDSITWSKDLDGVTVTRMRRLVKADADKLSYDVKNDEDAKASTVLDMLRKVPMVSVDGEDNITVNGSSSFKVYVDGKPNMMMSSAPSQVFKSMPASMVKSIEVVTNPGAKYDAEGGAGVLNIVMNKEMMTMMGGGESLNGYNGTLRVQAGNRQLGGSAFVSGQQGKLSYSTNITYSKQTPGTTTTTMERTQLGALSSTMLSESESKMKIPFTMGNLTLGYELDAKSSIGLTAGITSFNMNSDGLTKTTFGGGVYGPGFSYGNTNDTKMRRTSFNGSLDYQRFLNDARTSSITLTYQLTYAPTKSEMQSAFDQTRSGIRLFQAAYNGQIARNGDVTGWSMGWQTNTYSRCLDGDRARKNLSLALRHSGSYVIEMGNYGGCYYNLFDAHSPFQIDGNYGCTSGICEMLLQSYDDVITILPALPSAWKEGSVTGLKAQGNFIVSETWQDGKATSITIKSNAGQPLRIRYEGLEDYYIRLNGEKVTPTNDGEVYTIPNVKEGDVVTIDKEDPDGLETVRRPFGDGAEAKLYNLAGQPVGKDKPTKGIVVQKGKKIIK